MYYRIVWSWPLHKLKKLFEKYMQILCLIKSREKLSPIHAYLLLEKNIYFAALTSRKILYVRVCKVIVTFLWFLYHLFDLRKQTFIPRQEIPKVNRSLVTDVTKQSSAIPHGNVRCKDLFAWGFEVKRKNNKKSHKNEITKKSLTPAPHDGHITSRQRPIQNRWGR